MYKYYYFIDFQLAFYGLLQLLQVTVSNHMQCNSTPVICAILHQMLVSSTRALNVGGVTNDFGATNSVKTTHISDWLNSVYCGYFNYNNYL